MPSHDFSDEEISVYVADLLTEVDTAMRHNRWAILRTGTDSIQHRLYDAAALRHCCQLLADIEQSSKAGQEQVVRILARTHLEAWLYALYIHFGGFGAITRVAQNTYYYLRANEQAHQEFDLWLAREKKSVRKKIKSIRKTNAGIQIWNAQHPDQPPKFLHDEPHVPQLLPTHADFQDWMGPFRNIEPRRLTVEEIAAMLTKLGPQHKFAYESLTPLYLNYRMLSAGMIHPTLHLYDSYMFGGNFARVDAKARNASLIPMVRVTSLYATASLAGRVIGDSELETPIADKITSFFAPGNTD